MQKNKKYFEIENEKKFGKKSFQQRLDETKEAEQAIIDYLESPEEEEDHDPDDSRTY